MEIDTKSSEISAFEEDKLVLVEVKSALIQDGSEEEIVSESFSFSIRFERLGQKDEAEEDDEEEETTSNKFEGVVIGEEVEVEVREQNYTIPDPIKAEIEQNTETGIIEISFSRSIRIQFDQFDEDQ